MTHFHGEDGKMLCGREYVDGWTRRATEDNLIKQWSGERREECCLSRKALRQTQRGQTTVNDDEIGPHKLIVNVTKEG